MPDLGSLHGWLHGWTGLCAVLLSGVILKGRNPSFRFKMGGTEQARADNFALISLCFFTIGLDMWAVPLGIQGWWHYAAIIVASLVSTTTIAIIVWRAATWKG